MLFYEDTGAAWSEESEGEMIYRPDTVTRTAR